MREFAPQRPRDSEARASCRDPRFVKDERESAGQPDLGGKRAQGRNPERNTHERLPASVSYAKFACRQAAGRKPAQIA
jgi:hypothetical protein